MFVITRRRLATFHRAHRITIDARNPRQLANRIAGQAEVMLHAKFGSTLDLRHAVTKEPQEV